MSTPHNRAENGDFAKTVLMPGDRCAPNSLQRPSLNPRALSPMCAACSAIPGPTRAARSASWAAAWACRPSASIRMSSTPSTASRASSASARPVPTPKKARLFDVVLATGAYSESSYAATQSGDSSDIQRPERSAQRGAAPQRRGPGHPADRRHHPFFGRVLPPAQRPKTDLLGAPAR